MLIAYIPGGLEHSFEEFAQLRTEQGEEADRSRAVEEINEKYDSEFVGPPLYQRSGPPELRRILLLRLYEKWSRSDDPLL